MKPSRSTWRALSLETFVAFDVETTGLDPDRNEILEIGMVRVENGTVSGRYNRLYKPTVPIPRNITQLTGIRPEDCENQAALAGVFEEALDWMGDGWLVGHNPEFDLGFIRRAQERVVPDRFPIPSSQVLDTLELSRILMPWFSSHSLQTVADQLGISMKPAHRAAADAEVTALVLCELVPAALSADPRAVALIDGLLDGASDGLRLFFQKVGKMHRGKEPVRRIPNAKAPGNVLGRETDRPEPNPLKKIDEARIDEFFNAGGILANLLPQYESRRPQSDMARSVGKALNQDAFLLAEAGTGVGKSMAYLVPAALWVTENPSQRVIVTTNTKNLQDQLFFKELPRLAAHFGETLTAVLLKGRANYLCLRRWNHVINHLSARFPLEVRRKLLPLVSWVMDTRTGDVEENSGFSLEKNRALWSQINSEGDHCLGSMCEHERTCFFQRIRRASKNARIVVVNHSLLLSGLGSVHQVLGEFDTLIVDEVHHFERTASQILGSVFLLRPYQELGQRLVQPVGREVGMLPALEKLLRKTVKDPDRLDKGLTRIRRLKADVAEWHEAALVLFRILGETLLPQTGQPGFQKKRIRSRKEWMGESGAALGDLESTSQTLDRNLEEFASGLAEIVSGDPLLWNGWMHDLETVRDALASLRNIVSVFAHEPEEGQVVWAERFPDRNIEETALWTVPLDIAQILGAGLYPSLSRCVLTSATVTVAEQFDYMIGRLGLDHLEPERLLTKVFGSPFDWNDQVRFLVPSFVSNPRNKEFTSDVAELIRDVVVSHRRGTLVLFTSHSMLQEVYRTVSPSFEKQGIRLFAQGLNGTRTALLRLFQEEKPAVLFGTSSFWEGIDVPGSALEILIVTKIPFDVPTDPLIQARAEQIQQATGNSFLNYSVPEAIVRLRQGFGRLIRSMEDRGAVLLLDPRVVDNKYGGVFLDSLPVKARICGEPARLMDELEEWFG